MSATSWSVSGGRQCTRFQCKQHLQNDLRIYRCQRQMRCERSEHIVAAAFVHLRARFPR